MLNPLISYPDMKTKYPFVSVKIICFKYESFNF